MDTSVGVDGAGMRCTHGNGVQAARSPLEGGSVVRLPHCELPTDCNRILIVGAGGFGREVFRWARDTWADQASCIAGFLSDDLSRLDGFSLGVGILSAVGDYRPKPGDYLLLAIGVPYSRRRVADQLQHYHARFLTLVHPTAIVADSCDIGAGSIVCPFAVVSDSARLGRFVLINYYASVGHDATVGDYAVLSPYATLGGHAHVADEAFLGMHTSVGPGRVVGARSKISANSCLLSNAPPDSLVYGVPGHVSPRVSISGA